MHGKVFERSSFSTETDMDSAAYALVGTLSGVVITQISTLLLEERRIKHRRKDEERAYKRVVSKEMQATRQDAYSKFLAEFDYYFANGNQDRTLDLLKAFYAATLVASVAAFGMMRDLMNEAQKDFDGEKMLTRKGALLRVIREELAET
jgi:hypothetical protein